MNFNKKITLLHKTTSGTADTWTKKEYTGASWYADRSKATQDNTTTFGYLLSCRVKKCYGFVADIGDYVILGSIAETTINSSNVLSIVQSHRPNAFQIKLYRDNTDKPYPHYRLEGV